MTVRLTQHHLSNSKDECVAHAGSDLGFDLDKQSRFLGEAKGCRRRQSARCCFLFPYCLSIRSLLQVDVNGCVFLTLSSPNFCALGVSFIAVGLNDIFVLIAPMLARQLFAVSCLGFSAWLCSSRGRGSEHGALFAFATRLKLVAAF